MADSAYILSLNQVTRYTTHNLPFYLAMSQGKLPMTVYFPLLFIDVFRFAT